MDLPVDIEKNKITEKVINTDEKYALISKQILNQKDNILWNILNSKQVPNESLNEITIMNAIVRRV